MNNFIKELSESILSLHRYSKRAIALSTDASLCILCTWLAYVLRLEELVLFKDFGKLLASNCVPFINIFLEIEILKLLLSIYLL